MWYGVVFVIAMLVLVCWSVHACHQSYLRRYNAWADSEINGEVHADEVMQGRQ